MKFVLHSLCFAALVSAFSIDNYTRTSVPKLLNSEAIHFKERTGGDSSARNSNKANNAIAVTGISSTINDHDSIISTDSNVVNNTSFDPCAVHNHIGCFTSVQPMPQTEGLRLPDSHTFQLLAATGDQLTKGGLVGANNDFTAFLSLNGSSTKGCLSVNHETNPGGVSLFGIQYDFSSKLWMIDSSEAVNFSSPGLVKTINNCSGGITPWGTVITSEESYNTGDDNNDGYTDVGWHVEIDPVTGKVMDYDNDGVQDKLWAMGRMVHENIALANDSLTAYYGEDGGSSGLYKFVAHQKTKFYDGNLYVMQRTGNTGTWIQVPNTTKAQRNTVASVVSGLGATYFNGIEDVEINPINGMIYFTSKGNSMIYRFKDNGMTVSDFEDYVGDSSKSFQINYGTGTQMEPWGYGIDNLAFDNLGNLWAQQDGSRNHLWVIRPDHTPTNPKVDLFATTPQGSEATGLTFSPDYRYGFLSIQHPDHTNAAPQIDAAGNTVVFNRSSTIVFANKAFLGYVSLPVSFAGFTVNKTSDNAVLLNWKTNTESNSKRFEVERSIDGSLFEQIGNVVAAGNSTTTRNYQFEDNALPVAGKVYYRIRQVDNSGRTTLSAVQSVAGARVITKLETFPNPFNNELNLRYQLAEAGKVTLVVKDANGRQVLTQTTVQQKGAQQVKVSTQALSKGIYYITIVTKNGSEVIKVSK